MTTPMYPADPADLYVAADQCFAALEQIFDALKATPNSALDQQRCLAALRSRAINLARR
jgi:hypothetical protein